MIIYGSPYVIVVLQHPVISSLHVLDNLHFISSREFNISDQPSSEKLRIVHKDSATYETPYVRLILSILIFIFAICNIMHPF